MGDRAVIINYVEGETEESFTKDCMQFREGKFRGNDQIGIYLHWNGSPLEVVSFLLYCRIRQIRNTNEDCYGWARFCQIVGNYIGGNLSMGIGLINELDCDNWDNGTYLIKNWNIVDRYYQHEDEKENKCNNIWFKVTENGEKVENWEILEMLYKIDEKQPVEDQVGKKRLKQKFEDCYLPF